MLSGKAWKGAGGKQEKYHVRRRVASDMQCYICSTYYSIGFFLYILSLLGFSAAVHEDALCLDEAIFTDLHKCKDPLAYDYCPCPLIDTIFVYKYLHL